MSEKRCPFCAEVIKAEAIKCRYCRSDLSGNGTLPPVGAAYVATCAKCNVALVGGRVVHQADSGR